jgi:hypothetical protein
MALERRRRPAKRVGRPVRGEAAEDVRRRLVAAEVASGDLRADLDPKLAMLSLFGMSVFPFLAHPLAGKVLGYELDADFAERLIEHTTRLFFDGARAHAEPT